MELFDFTAKHCKNCYKCVRACPVKAIRFQENRAVIDEERCIACGQCFVVCPKDAKNTNNDTAIVQNRLETGCQMVACIDSSYLGAFEDPGKFITALKKLGFISAQETAVGSEAVIQEYIHFINKNSHLNYIISSSCTSVYLFVRIYYPQLTKYLIPVVTPALAIGKAVKKENPNCYTVYIGPCLSKKYEADPLTQNAPINYHITFDEILRLFIKKGIHMEELAPSVPDRTPKMWGENYSVSGDMWSTLRDTIAQKGYDIFPITGLDHVKNLFGSMEHGTLGRAYIGISACDESCANGPFIPKRMNDVFTRKQKIRTFAKTGWQKNMSQIDWSQIDLSTKHTPRPLLKAKASPNELQAILKSMGKYTKSQELNCGACGYDTCMQKAQAVYEGMAEIEMCMPYMRSRAENINSSIFHNSRNTIIILDSDLRIVNFNPTAEAIFQIAEQEVIGTPISNLMDNSDFLQCRETKTDVTGKKVHLLQQKKDVLVNIIYIQHDSGILITMQDVTEDEHRKAEYDQLKTKTLETTKNVIEKQMRVAQLIASLLGETTAETKVALNKLKDLVVEEEKI